MGGINSMDSRPPSKRFSPTSRTERWIPVLLILLALVLLATVTIVLLAVLGLMRGA